MREFLWYLLVATILMFFYWLVDLKFPEFKAYAFGFVLYLMFAYGKIVGKAKVWNLMAKEEV